MGLNPIQFNQYLKRGMRTGDCLDSVYASEIDDRLNVSWKNPDISDLIKSCLSFNPDDRIDVESLSDTWMDIIKTYPHDERRQVIVFI